MKTLLATIGTLLLLITGPSSSGQIVVDLTTEGWTPLLPNTPNQTRQIHVSGGGNVWGMNYRIQVEDGFPDGPGKDGPNIPNVESAVDITTGTIFASGTTSAFDALNNGEQFAFRSVTVNPGPVSASGLLATVTFDTTGLFNADTYAIKLIGTIGGNTQFLNSGGTVLAANITNGQISVAAAVPEPASGLAVASGLLVGAWFLRRKRCSG